MADIVQSPFGLTPEAYRQQQANEASRMALGYAQLTPQQRASFGAARAGYQLGEVLGGALGGQDPMLQMISNRQAIARQVDYTNPESMASGVQALADAGDTVGAMQLSQVLRQAQSELAQRTQKLASAQASFAAAGRERTEASPNDVRIAREFAALKGEPGSAEYNAEFTSQLTRLTTKPEGAGPREVQLARELALRAGPVGSPEYIAAYNAELGRLTAPERAAESTPEIRNAAALASQKGQPGSPEYQAEFATQLARLTTKTEADRPTDAMRNADALALLKGPKGSTEYNAEYAAQLARLTTREQAPQRGPSVGGDREAISLELFNTTFDQLTTEQRARVNQRVEAEQGRKAAAAAPQIRIENKGLEAFAQSRGKTQAELLNEATLSARGASQALSTISNMKQLNASGQLFTGPLANPVLGASSLLASVGLISPEQRNRLTSSEVYDKQAKDLVMQDLGGKLGAQISDADRKFVEARIPQLTTSAQARTELLNKLEEIQRGKIDFYRRANAHANQFGNLNTFDFSQQYSPVAPAGGWSIRRVEPAK